MLKLAVAATLPLIAVTTRDVLNLPDVLKEITGKTPQSWLPNQKLDSGALYMLLHPSSAKLPLVDVYKKLVKAEATLVLVNPDKIVEPMFNAGEVPTPRRMILKFMKEVVDDLGKATQLSRGLGGCTLKEAAELARLTMARDNSLTINGLMQTRKSSFQASNGLAQVDTKQDFYDPPEQLAGWIDKEKMFFLEAKDHRLMPRGLLFDGPPGTGKTAGAKYVAAQWGIPLYRVDIGGTKNKYVGESEQNMLTNLSRLDHEEPCVALLDEVEKVFSTATNDSSGTTSTMLSQLLWWLAERRSKVLVVMTTNNAKALPKELYREGRIDETMWFGGVQGKQAIIFVQSVLKSLGVGGWSALNLAEIVKATAGMPGDGGTSYTQAALTKATYSWVKAKQKPVAGDVSGSHE